MADKEKKKDKEKDKGKDKEKEKEKGKDKEKKKDKDKEGDLTTRTGLKDKSKLIGTEMPESVLGDELLASPTVLREKLCIHHQQKLFYYCESCEEPICEQCTIIGPHNNQLHRYSRVPDAYKSRIVAMHQIISGGLLPKRDQLMSQAHRIDQRLEEIKYAKTIIERDVRSEFGGILERLRSAEGVKLAMLQHEIATLQRDIDKINDAVKVVNDLTAEKGEPIDFLLRSRHLTDSIEFGVAKPFKTTIEVVPYDLPRELAKQRERIEKINIAQDILDMKDQVIFELFKKLTIEEEKVSAEMNKAAQEEIIEWSKLTDRFANELRKYQTICYYCGSVMNTTNINQVCEANAHSESLSRVGFTNDAPDQGWHGTKRHFFAKPKPGLIRAGQPNTAGISDLEYIERKERERLENLSKAQYEMFLEVLLAKIRKLCTQKDIKIEKLFAEQDKKGAGVINHIAFTFLLHEFCGIDLIEVEKLRNVLDPHNKNEIHYEELVKLVNDPQYLAVFQGHQ